MVTAIHAASHQALAAHHQGSDHVQSVAPGVYGVGLLGEGCHYDAGDGDDGDDGDDDCEGHEDLVVTALASGSTGAPAGRSEDGLGLGSATPCRPAPGRPAAVGHSLSKLVP